MKLYDILLAKLRAQLPLNRSSKYSDAVKGSVPAKVRKDEITPMDALLLNGLIFVNEQPKLGYNFLPNIQ